MQAKTPTILLIPPIFFIIHGNTSISGSSTMLKMEVTLIIAVLPMMYLK